MSEPLQKNWAMKFVTHYQGCVHLLDVTQQVHLLVKGSSEHLISSNLTQKCVQHLNFLGTRLRYLLKRSLRVKFVCLLYGGISDGDVNFLRYSSFCTKNMQAQQLLPTRDSLHSKLPNSYLETCTFSKSHHSITI